MSRPLRRLAAAVAVVLAAGALPTLGLTNAGAAPDDSMFSPAPGFRPGAQARVSPERYAAVRVDLAQVRSALVRAPGAQSGPGSRSLEFSVPTPTGGVERFALQRTTLMQSELAAAHPEISTYAGDSLDHPGTTIALDVTPMGLHASVRDPQGQRAWYVDPAYNRRGTTTHLSYYAGSVEQPADGFVERETPAIRQAISDRRTGKATAPGALVQQRIYRLALTSDPSYADYFGTENVLAEKVTLINRVNQIYNDDLAINLRLVNDQDKINFDTDAEATGPDGPCGAHACFDAGTPATDGQLDFCDVGTLGRNRVVLGQLIGASNYDIGHIALGVNGGGIAYFGVVGKGYKGGGCTGLPEPRGDFYAIDYVAHEMGHQFAGNHTFDGVKASCSGGNRHGRSSVEPGSGSSVMAYAGICASDDLQPHTDPYFSQRSIQEISGYTSTGAAPVVEVQTVSLRGFDTDGEQIMLRYGPGAPVTLTRGTDYDANGLEAALEQLTGLDVTISGWAYDPLGSYTEFPAALTQPDDTGFQVIFAQNARPGAPGPKTDLASLEVSSPSAGVSGFVGETAQGGPADNRGFEVVATANHAPRVKAPVDRTIPLRTPFTLKGSGTDVDGDSLTYLWEQNDTGPRRRGTSLVSNDKQSGPLFRVFGTYADVTPDGALQTPSPGENVATGSARRTFPDLSQILAGNTNARSGHCPARSESSSVTRRALNCFSEFLPVAGYVGTAGTRLAKAAMHFRLTARDGSAVGGGTAYDGVTLRISQSAGPFLVTSQSRKGDAVTGGKRARVTWQVNGTRPLARNVRILLSIDGGRTWTTTLAKKTANDGRAAVRFPRAATSAARVMVEARGNYFFDTNDRDFAIR